MAENSPWQRRSVEAVSDEDMMIVHVVALKVEEEAPAADAAAVAATPAEPEVIKKGKADKEEEPAAKK